MTDTRKEFEAVILNMFDGVLPSDELYDTALESWQACQSLNDKRIQQLLAVIRVKDEALNKAQSIAQNTSLTESLSGVVDANLFHIWNSSQEALALQPADVKLVEVMEATGGGMLYTIKTKE